jgi:predicted dehydrogenase
MPDVGIYCLNAARFLSEEEPSEIMASLYQPIDDPRFAEVEASCQVIAKFPSGMTAVFNSGYDGHKSQFLRVEGAGAWAELNPAFSYSGIKLRYKKLQDDMDIVIEPSIEEKDQFAAEMDHMAICVKRDLIPHTPGEEGLQDQRITDAIYESAMTGRAVRLSSPPGTTRGPTSS